MKKGVFSWERTHYTHVLGSGFMDGTYPMKLSSVFGVPASDLSRAKTIRTQINTFLDRWDDLSN